MNFWNRAVIIRATGSQLINSFTRGVLRYVFDNFYWNIY